MKKVVVLLLLGAVAAFAAVADVSPYAGKPATGNYDAWGGLVRSWSITVPSSGVKAGAANIAPHTTLGYKMFITGAWSGFTAFGVYDATTGTALGSVTTSGISGMRDGSGKCHLGNGYFVLASGGPGPAYPVTITETTSAPYVNLAIGSTPVISSVGRGIAWGGTYYYATTGTWSSPVGIYTSTGSQVGTWTLSSSILSGLYGIASRVPNDGYLYTFDQATGSPVRQSNSSGSIVRSFTTASSSAGGLDTGWSDGYLYCCSQTPNSCFVYDGELGFTNIAPASIGKIKSLYR